MLSIKKNLLTSILTLASFAVLAVPAFAGAGKAPLYGPSDPGFTCPTGGNAVGTAMGFVVMNTNNSGDLIVEASLKGALPNTTYDIYVNQDPGDCPTVPTGTIITNKQGNGNTHITEIRVPAATNFWVSAVGGGQVLRSPAVTLD